MLMPLKFLPRACFLKWTERHKNGKIHRYRSVVENRRLAKGRIAQHASFVSI
ncbi:MAG: hypothetical protein ACYDBH_25200 [Acidobacteriaceae bacterium]